MRDTSRRCRLFSNPIYKNRNITYPSMDAQNQGDVVGITIHYLFLVDGHVLATMRRQ